MYVPTFRYVFPRIHLTFRTYRVGSSVFSRTASNWFRKFVKLNAEAQRTLRTAEDPEKLVAYWSTEIADLSPVEWYAFGMNPQLSCRSITWWHFSSSQQITRTRQISSAHLCVLCASAFIGRHRIRIWCWHAIVLLGWHEEINIGFPFDGLSSSLHAAKTHSTTNREVENTMKQVV